MEKMKLEQLEKLKEESHDFALINVLPERDYQLEHIPESVNVPVDSDDFTRRVEQYAGDKRKTIVVYCAHEDCNAAEKAARKLDEDGFKRVYHFEGGMREWKRGGYPFETGSVLGV